MKKISLSLLVSLVILLHPSVIMAISPTDRNAVDTDTPFYDPYFSSPDTCLNTTVPGPAVLIGDSLSSADGLQAHGIASRFQDAGWPLTVDGEVSRPLVGPSFPQGDGMATIDRLSSAIQGAHAVIMELGTNPSASSGADFGAQVSQAIDKIRALNSSAVIYWVNIGAVTNPIYGDYNKALSDQSTAKGFKVIDWFKTAYPDSDPFVIDGNAQSQYIPAGNVHPNGSGYDALTNLIVSSVTTGAVVPSATPAVDIPGVDMNAINALKPLYIQAAQATNVPWQLLAAVHFREHSNAKDNPNSDGAYQIVGGGYAAGPLTDEQFVQESIDAANFIRGKKSTVLANHQVDLTLSQNDPEVIKDYLFSYNGRAGVYAQQAATLGFDSTTQPYEGSPYVMNNYDAVHMNMGIITQDGGGISGTDSRPGAYTVYAKLLGLGGGCS